MDFLIKQARIILCAVIILAFFIPAYQNISGFTFISTAFSKIDGQTEIMVEDVIITVIPLVMIPVSALLILIGTYRRRSIQKTFKALPLICLVIFTCILFMTLRSIVG